MSRRTLASRFVAAALVLSPLTAFAADGAAASCDRDCAQNCAHAERNTSPTQADSAAAQSAIDHNDSSPG